MIKINYVFFLWCLFFHSVYLLNISSTLRNIPEDGKLEYCRLANKYGFNCIEYDVVTEDGYILKVFRIPGNTSIPVFYMHGVLDTSDSCLARGDSSLCLILAKAGYDVWAGNVRGNRYSRRHTYLDPDLDKKSFWDFSIDEHSLIDLPVMLDFVLETTNQERLSYVGLSQGTTIMYALAAAKPKYNQKVNIFISMASVCYLQYLGEPLLGLAHAAPLLAAAIDLTGEEEIAGYNSATKKAINVACTQSKISYDVCVKNIIFPVIGLDPDEFEPEFLPIFIGHFPAGTSKKNLVHFSQLARSGRFQKYDYGALKNKIIYKSDTPPEYDIIKVTMKVALFIGKNDRIATVTIAKTLQQNLPNVVRYTVVKQKSWNHLDFVLAKNAYKYLYPDILDTIKQFSS